ncbi:MAG: DUF6438 domain-containing protein [Caulobacterales bacterium]
MSLYSVARRTALGVFAALALAACATAPAGPAAPSATDSLTLERGVCFGFCPDYIVTIRGDGSVSYEGRRFTRVEGAQTAQADPVQTAALFARAEEMGFFDLQDAYRAHVTDIPQFRVTYTRGGRTKTIVDYGGRMMGMPESVTQLEEEIDRVAGTDRWVKRDGQPAPSK